MSIKYNSKDITPRFNGKDVSRVMFNGKQIYPSDKGINPTTAPNGIYIYSNDGKLYNPEEWNTANNDLAVGVAVVDDNCKFAIGKIGRSELMPWSIELYGIDIDGILSTANDDAFREDYNGENNSKLIREATLDEPSSDNAAHWCYEQIITVNGIIKHGYLAAGEWNIAYNNKSAINDAMNKIAGENIVNGQHWASTEYNGQLAYFFNYSNNETGFNYKNRNYYVCPFYILT